MEPYKWNRKARAWIAALTLAGGSLPAFAQPPQVEEEPEIYYGAAKVGPAPASVPDAAPVIPAVIPAAAESEAKPRAGESIAEAMHSVRDGTREVSSAAVRVLGSVGDRIRHTAESRPIIIATFVPPPTTLPTPSVTVQTAASPAPIVVMKEAEPRPEPAVASPTSSGVTLSVESLIAGGVGLLGMLLAAMAWARGSRKQPAMPQPVVAAASMPLDPNSVHLMGQYNAGPKREAAESFDLGPTYAEELSQKKHAEAANDAAAVEFILSQNLSFLAEMNPGEEGTMVQTDEEGFAVPALA